MIAVLRWSHVGMGLVVVVLLTQGCGGNDETASGSGATSSGSGSVVPYRHIPVTTALALPDNAPIRSVMAEMRGAPDAVRQGEVMRFVVTLSNPGPESVMFDPCPIYFMVFGESSVSTEPLLSFLNCDEAGPIPPGGSQDFAMEFDLPDSFETSGENSIYWRLEDIDDASSGPITFTGRDG
jgi:hypothetical protein